MASSRRSAYAGSEGRTPSVRTAVCGAARLARRPGARARNPAQRPGSSEAAGMRREGRWRAASMGARHFKPTGTPSSLSVFWEVVSHLARSRQSH